MTGPPAKLLNGKQAKALSALLTTSSLTQAAKLSGVSERSLYRFLRTAHFADTYRRLRDEQVEQAVAHLQQLTARAVKVLDETMRDGFAKPAAKVMAARTVLMIVLGGSDAEREGRISAPPAPSPTFDLSN